MKRNSFQGNAILVARLLSFLGFENLFAIFTSVCMVF